MSSLGTLQDLPKYNLDNTVIVSVSDTTYGFHARASSARARLRIETLKQRHGNFIILVSSYEEAKLFCEISPDAQKLINHYWPGPITFILPSIDMNVQTIAIRLPRDPFCHHLIHAFGGPILSTSCNLPGMPPIRQIEEAVALFGDAVDLYIDGGFRSEAQPSTVVDLTVVPPKVLRQGEVVFNIQPNHE